MSAGAAHRLALLHKWETQLSPAKLEVWRTLMEMLPQDSPLVGNAGSWGLECALMAHVMKGATVEQVVKMRLIPQRNGGPRQVDHRAAAAGDKDFAA